MRILRKLTIGPLFGAALLLAAVPCSAGFRTGNELLEKCTAGGEGGHSDIDFAYCLGYLGGVADAKERVLVFWIKKGDLCIPAGTTADQLRHVFLRWMNQSPELWHLDAGGLVTAAFRQAWPCPD